MKVFPIFKIRNLKSGVMSCQLFKKSLIHMEYYLFI